MLQPEPDEVDPSRGAAGWHLRIPGRDEVEVAVTVQPVSAGVPADLERPSELARGVAIRDLPAWRSTVPTVVSLDPRLPTAVDQAMSENFSFEPGIYYSLKGYELNGALSLKGLDFLGANAKAILQSQYVDIPVLLKGNFGGFQIFAGPQISYLASANLKTTAGVLGINLLNKTMDVTSQFNRWDVGVTGGIGYQFINGLNISASYDYGLSKADANQNVNAYNRAIKVGIGITSEAVDELLNPCCLDNHQLCND